LLNNVKNKKISLICFPSNNYDQSEFFIPSNLVYKKQESSTKNLSPFLIMFPYLESREIKVFERKDKNKTALCLSSGALKE
jgi:hypothetical protein